MAEVPQGEVNSSLVLHALAEPHRASIVRLLVDKQLAVKQLVAATGMTQPLVSHHLKVLRDAGLTRTRVDGSRRLVSLRAEEVDRRFPGLLESVLRASTAA